LTVAACGALTDMDIFLSGERALTRFTIDNCIIIAQRH
jgi:hypothetical protein